MVIDELARRENTLLNKVEQAVGIIEEKNAFLEKEGVFDDFKKIFDEYLQVHREEIEALKRCLFLYWYSASEPHCFTGLSEFDSGKVEAILNTLNEKLSHNNTDYEIEWMLGYYSNWDYIFEPFPQFNFIIDKIKVINRVKMPDKINRTTMLKRGQMGMYWNSLIIFQ